MSSPNPKTPEEWAGGVSLRSHLPESVDERAHNQGVLLEAFRDAMRAVYEDAAEAAFTCSEHNEVAAIVTRCAERLGEDGE